MTTVPHFGNAPQTLNIRYKTSEDGYFYPMPWLADGLRDRLDTIVMNHGVKVNLSSQIEIQGGNNPNSVVRAKQELQQALTGSTTLMNQYLDVTV